MRQRILHEFYEWPRKDAVAFDSEHRANSVRRTITRSWNTFHIFYIYFCIVSCKFHSFLHGYIRALDRRSGISGEVTFYIGWNWNVFFYHHSDSWKYLNTLPPNAFIDISCVFCDVNTNSNYATVDIFLKTFETKCWKEIEETAVSFCSPGERQTWKSVVFVANPSI